jgi:hypothetical protein
MLVPLKDPPKREDGASKNAVRQRPRRRGVAYYSVRIRYARAGYSRVRGGEQSRELVRLPRSDRRRRGGCEARGGGRGRVNHASSSSYEGRSSTHNHVFD